MKETSITPGQERQYLRFAGDALQKAGLDRSGLQNVIANGGELQSSIVETIKKLARRVIYRLTKIGDGRTTEELTQDGKYNCANPDINSKNFPARARKEKSAEIVFIEGKDFDHDPTSEEVLQEAEKRGLKHPVYEDGFYFGVEHPEVQREAPVVFLHEPWRGSVGYLRVLCLWSLGGHRELDLRYFSGRWSRHCRFAFVRK